MWFYDAFVAAERPEQTDDPRISLVLIRESDIRAFDYPLRDALLARLIEKIENGGAALVGVDLYRDLPEPRDGSEQPILTKVLQRYPNVIGIFLFGTEKEPFRIPPAAALRDDSNRFGFNDFVVDYKTVRRGFLFLPNSWNYSSFAWLLAQYYLGAHDHLSPSMDGTNIRIGKATLPRFYRTDGAYIDAEDGGYQILFDFRGPRHFTTRSVSETLALNEPNAFKNQIVIIGGGSDSARDVFDTPVGDAVPGPVLHAQLVNQILRAALLGSSPLRSPSVLEKWLLTLLLCAAGGWTGYRVRSYLLYSLTLLVGGLGVIVLIWSAFKCGWWLPATAPVLNFLVSAITVKSYFAYYGEQQRGKLMKLFSQHVTPHVAEMLWQERDKFFTQGRPSAQRLTATVIFTDLEDFSSISQKMTASELMDWLNECLGEFAGCVDQRGGMVNKFIGDAVMAVFGVPVARTTEAEIERDARQAVACALDMSRAINELNAKWRDSRRLEAKMRIGIHTGELMAGVVGHAERLEYTVIGDSVNVAARLESVDKDNSMQGGVSDECRIYISEATCKLIEAEFDVRLVGATELKGYPGKANIFKVLAKKADKT